MKLHCTQEGCNGPEGGTCIENLEFDQCPHVQKIQDSDVQTTSPEEDQTVQLSSEMVTTSPGPSINEVGCDALLRQRNAKLIALVGGPNVGKTTLLAGIYELCRRGQLSDFSFAGCETIFGFENRCFLARVRSGGEEADTQHTTKLSFTHLRVGADNGINEWLFSDRPGENFDHARNYPDEMATFSEVERADILIILLDGERLLNSHQAALAEARSIAMILDQQSLLIDRPTIMVVTKSDKLVAQENRKIVEQRVSRLVDSIRARNPNVCLPIFFVSSRAHPGEPFKGEGYNELLTNFQIPDVEKEFGLVCDKRFTDRYPDALSLLGNDQS